MGPLYSYSLVPVFSVALLLFFTAALRGRNARGLAAYCLSVAAWSGALLLINVPEASHVGERLAAVGAFTAAGYLHAAFDVTSQKRYGLVWLAYLVAVAITLLGAVEPGVLYGPLAMQRGPLFWPAVALAIAAATVPMVKLRGAWRDGGPEKRRVVLQLLVAGVLGYSGGLGNALLLSSGRPLPVGMYLSLASLLVLANVIRAHEPVAERRLLERSLLYSALAAFLSAAFLFGVMALMSSTTRFLTEYRLGALFLLCMAALAFEPLRQGLQEWLGRRLFRGAGAADLARELAAQKARADQAGRLAELGTFASAVAHEVRNPLGVLSAHLKVLERKGADAETLAAMREQIERASHFVDELLRYGRPRPLELRLVDLGATVDLALSTARQGLGPLSPEGVTIERDVAASALVEADQGQLTQLLVVLFENAFLALADAERRTLRVTAKIADGMARIGVEDSGPGIPPEVLPRLFQPFVTARKRDGTRPGTGLGLAIARGIVERHGGRIEAGRSELGGARFDVTLPRVQAVLAAATAK